MKKTGTLLLLLTLLSPLVAAQYPVNSHSIAVEPGGFTLESLLRGMLGMLVVIAIAWAFSTNRRAVNWKVVATGLGIQLTLALSILHLPFVQQIFEFVGHGFVKMLSFTEAGTTFLFSSFSSGEIESPLVNFAITILPTIIFFSAFTSVLFYFGIIQKIVYIVAFCMTRLLRLSGAEGLAVAGNIFLGQTEAPMMIKAYLEKMNRSEMLLVMSAGMATLAGGVLAVYIKILGGGDPAQELIFAKHLLAASIMAEKGVVINEKIIINKKKNDEKEEEVSR